MRTRGPCIPFHLLRSSAVATVILTLAVGAHLAGGGGLPAPVILLAGGQLALHGVFTAFAPFTAGAAPTGAAAPHAGHLPVTDIVTPAANLAGTEAARQSMKPSALRRTLQTAAAA
ncbi:hypothetical protein [Pseudarthrobacter sp. R1]|uniref:hypothetical protein n=1 Tax=Pseudarthrobacter sp. R1 TaxID=2944934 RepID=UPI0027377804|nr:hypothetical protein [Pseudarthrobacter sp. R1]